MKIGQNTIDTGKILDNHIRKNKINKSNLASVINRSGQSITKYENNSSIQTGILLDICYALKHNFFQDIANLVPREFTVDSESSSAIHKTIADLQEENKVLKIQNELLMRLKG